MYDPHEVRKGEDRQVPVVGVGEEKDKIFCGELRVVRIVGSCSFHILSHWLRPRFTFWLVHLFSGLTRMEPCFLASGLQAKQSLWIGCKREAQFDCQSLMGKKVLTAAEKYFFPQQSFYKFLILHFPLLFFYCQKCISFSKWLQHPDI